MLRGTNVACKKVMKFLMPHSSTAACLFFCACTPGVRRHIAGEPFFTAFAKSLKSSPAGVKSLFSHTLSKMAINRLKNNDVIFYQMLEGKCPEWAVAEFTSNLLSDPNFNQLLQSLHGNILPVGEHNFPIIAQASVLHGRAGSIARQQQALISIEESIQLTPEAAIKTVKDALRHALICSDEHEFVKAFNRAESALYQLDPQDSNESKKIFFRLAFDALHDGRLEPNHEVMSRYLEALERKCPSQFWYIFQYVVSFGVHKRNFTYPTLWLKTDNTAKDRPREESADYLRIRDVRNCMMELAIKNSVWPGIGSHEPKDLRKYKLFWEDKLSELAKAQGKQTDQFVHDKFMTMLVNAKPEVRWQVEWILLSGTVPDPKSIASKKPVAVADLLGDFANELRSIKKPDLRNFAPAIGLVLQAVKEGKMKITDLCTYFLSEPHESYIRFICAVINAAPQDLATAIIVEICQLKAVDKAVLIQIGGASTSWINGLNEIWDALGTKVLGSKVLGSGVIGEALGSSGILETFTSQTSRRNALHLMRAALGAATNDRRGKEAALLERFLLNNGQDLLPEESRQMSAEINAAKRT